MEHALTGKEDLFMIVDGERNHTVDEVLALPEGERAELLNGEVFMMASPSTVHQAVLSWVNAAIFNEIRSRRGNCRVFTAPFAVFLKGDNKNYVEPDAAVICDREKLDEQGCHGAPDWVIEVVSPSSRSMDYQRKVEAYRSAGVREYWIVDPERKSVTVYDFAHGAAPSLYRFTDTVGTAVIEGLELDFNELGKYILDLPG